ncbi:TetR family transcriptional regulator [Corynebacterium imitans]|uniref:TetR/AcrR family transcriptional regulator n=1 Tax=Corynebacterium imitans TaxID=156978 RepID=UPI002549D3F0|nr:TetR family transcriptional regulator [Corynebacterium imitans]MDK8306108.1 TetR family transcriptional regulator [Corynebacterium imitans]MDK8637124.1 TetR family transcriptional regulator [Corynebacterium imitans]MDK8772203.1 TetR family transcriptional regulator [Corynebacterium imitans]
MSERKVQQQRARTKRDAIHEATVRLLLAEGMRAVTHRQVAAIADVPVGSIGYYFDSREKLIMTCFERVHARQNQILEDALADPKVREDREALAFAILNLTANGYPEQVRSIIAVTIDAGREGAVLQRMVRRQVEEAVRCIDQMLEYAGVTQVNGRQALGALVGAALVGTSWDKPVVETAVDGLVQFIELAERNASPSRD